MPQKFRLFEIFTPCKEFIKMKIPTIPRTETQGVYQAKYWREYRIYRRIGVPRSRARRLSSIVARQWYKYMKVYG